MSHRHPCPICGREMTAIETHPGRGELYCGKCDLTIGGNEAKTPEELQEIVEGGENAKLRRMVKRKRRHLEKQVERLKAENAKLRRLLRLIFDEDYGDEFTKLMCDLEVEEAQ